MKENSQILLPIEGIEMLLNPDLREEIKKIHEMTMQKNIKIINFSSEVKKIEEQEEKKGYDAILNFYKIF